MALEDSTAAAERLASALARLPDVRLAFLFGSRARGSARGDSDFDIAILVDPRTAGEERGRTIRRLAGQLGREVASERIDLVILNDAPSLLRHRVLRDGVVLFQRSPEERVRFATRAIRDYQDMFLRREAFTQRRIARMERKRTDDGGPGDLLDKARSAARLLGKAARVP
jgi:predicted nucleotidyltransferase